MSKVISVQGKAKEELKLPFQFKELYRPDLIRRAALAIMSHQIKPEGVSEEAGKRQSSYFSKRRDRYRTTYGYGQSRTPRKVMSVKGSRFVTKGASVPQAVGGRKAHPAKVEKVSYEKINKKEKRKAIRSAISATAIKDVVESRGHKVENIKDFPIIIEENIESIKKSKDVMELLKKLGLEKELERTKEKKVRAGKGKSRGRKYKRKTGPLFVVSKKCDLINSAKNLPGVDVCKVKDLNLNLLAPGTNAGRLTIWSENSIKLLEEKKLFE